MDREYERYTHEFGPVYDENSRILILGSFPSVKSRQQHFYYGHPQNRFWKLIAALTGVPLPVTVEEKRVLLLTHGIALWDVIESCEIIGSSDSTIRNVKVNDLSVITGHSAVSMVYLNGQKAGKLFDRYQKKTIDLPSLVLPSTSPANAAFSMERLLESWKIIRTHIC